MFVISQYILNKSGICKDIQQVSTYSIAVGLVVYSSIYLYVLFYNNKYLSVFNKFIMYIVIVDILLSIFYYFSIQKKVDYPFIEPDNEEYDDSNSNANKLDGLYNSSESEGQIESESEIQLESETEVEAEVEAESEEESRLYIEDLINKEKEQEIKMQQENPQIEDIVNTILSKKRGKKSKVTVSELDTTLI